MTAHVSGSLDVDGGSGMTAGQTVAAAMQPVIDDYAEDLIPRLPQEPFVQGLSVLLQVLRQHPELVDVIYHVTPGLSHHLEMRVLSGMGYLVFQRWARLLTDVSSSAYRYDEGVDGEISGVLEGIRMRIVGLIPGDAVPEGSGAHEWTLPEETA